MWRKWGSTQVKLTTLWVLEDGMAFRKTDKIVLLLAGIMSARLKSMPVKKVGSSFQHTCSNEDKTSLSCFDFCIDYSVGFGGKYGIEKDKQDQSAVGWEHVERPGAHPSQKGTTPSLFPVNQHVVILHASQ